MRDDADDLFHEFLVCGDLAIPTIQKFFDHNRDDSVDLKVDVVPARQWWKQFIKRAGVAATRVRVWTKYPSD